MSRYVTDQRVDDYIGALPQWQAALCQRVRDIVHDADKDVQETIKRRVQPYFVLNGNICALLAAKDHVNIFIYDPNAADPSGIINQGHNNKSAKAIQVKQNDVLNEAALHALFVTIIKRNRAGGWRTIASQGK